MPTATAKRPATKALVKNYAWSLNNEEGIKKNLTPFEFTGLQNVLDKLYSLGIKLQVSYKNIAMGKTKASDS